MPASGGGWDFSFVRKVNIFLDNASAEKAQVPPDDFAALLGEAKFFKARWYASMVQRFGDVPWLSTEMKEDSPELFGPRIDRKIVMDSVLNHIDYAIANLPDNTKNNSYINRNIALAEKARMFLFEGTFRKYHGLGDYTTYLQEAFDAAEALIDEQNYSLYTDFRELFNRTEKIGCPESIMIRDYAHDEIMTATNRMLQRIIRT